VAADLVGPGGSVVGVDRSPDALARARLQAGQRGLAQMRFVEGDIDDPAPSGPFGAIVERLVLWTVPDPAALLRRQATVLRSGGLVVPIEEDLSTIRSRDQLATAVRTVSAGEALLAPSITRRLVEDFCRRPARIVCVSHAASRCAARGSAAPVCPATVRRASAFVLLVFCAACWPSSQIVRLLGGLRASPCTAGSSASARASAPGTWMRTGP